MVDISTVALRTALASDLAGIRFVDPLMRADSERAQLIRSALERGECVLATDDDEILGFAILNYTFFYQGFVPLLVVGVGSRRCGVGAGLLSEVERRCAKAKLYVSANRSNLPAQLLFEKCGFVESGHVAHLDANDEEVFYFRPVQRHAPQPLAQPGRLAGGAHAPSARRRLAWFVRPHAHEPDGIASYVA